MTEPGSQKCSVPKFFFPSCLSCFFIGFQVYEKNMDDTVKVTVIVQNISKFNGQRTVVTKRKQIREKIIID